MRLKKIMKNSFLKFTIPAIILIILFTTATFAISVSPKELKIKNADENKAYKFIVLVNNDQPGLVDIEMKSSDPGVTISPNKFMLNEDERKSIRLGFNTRNLQKETSKIIVTPFVNNEPSQNRLTITLEKPTQDTIESKNKTPKSKLVIQEPEVIKIIILGLLIIVSLLIIAIFIPEIKRSLKKTNTKVKKIKSKINEKNINKSLSSIEKKIINSEKRIHKMTERIEKFHDEANSWLKKNSGGKYALE